jgi:hypothetical protein
MEKRRVEDERAGRGLYISVMASQDPPVSWRTKEWGQVRAGWQDDVGPVSW